MVCLKGMSFAMNHWSAANTSCCRGPLNGLNEFIEYYRTLKELAHRSDMGIRRTTRLCGTTISIQPVPDYWGVAVLIGHLHYHAAWETADGTITLELTGNRHSRLFLEYRSHNEGART